MLFVLLPAGVYFGWNPATEILFSGDGEYDVYGYWYSPILQEHYLSFGDIDISKAGVHRYSFRGFAPYDGPILGLRFNHVPTSVALASDVCFRASLFRKGRGVPIYTREECLAEVASLYAESYIDQYGFFVFLSPSNLEISRLRKYELVLEVVGDDDRLSGQPATLTFSSGWD